MKRVVITLTLADDTVKADLTSVQSLKRSEGHACAVMLIDISSKMLHMSMGMEDTEFVQAEITKASLQATDGGGD